MSGTAAPRHKKDISGTPHHYYIKGILSCKTDDNKPHSNSLMVQKIQDGHFIQHDTVRIQYTLKIQHMLNIHFRKFSK